jgi:hypothetical protein
MTWLDLESDIAEEFAELEEAQQSAVELIYNKIYDILRQKEHDIIADKIRRGTCLNCEKKATGGVQRCAEHHARQLQYAKTTRIRREESGLCRENGCPLAPERSGRCEGHAVKFDKWRAERRARLVSAGFCFRCGKLRGDEFKDKTICKACSDIYKVKWAAQHTKPDRPCAQCGGNVPGKIRWRKDPICSKRCRQIRRATELVASKKCIRCKIAPAREGAQICVGCSSSERERRAKAKPVKPVKTDKIVENDRVLVVWCSSREDGVYHTVSLSIGKRGRVVKVHPSTPEIEVRIYGKFFRFRQEELLKLS